MDQNHEFRKKAGLLCQRITSSGRPCKRQANRCPYAVANVPSVRLSPRPDIEWPRCASGDQCVREPDGGLAFPANPNCAWCIQATAPSGRLYVRLGRLRDNQCANCFLISRREQGRMRCLSCPVSDIFRRCPDRAMQIIDLLRGGLRP